MGKRLLSWIVLVGTSFLSLVLICAASTLVFSLLISLFGSAGRILWFLLTAGGLIFVFGYILVAKAIDLTVRASQKICLSRKGVRYIVVSVIILILYGLSLILDIVYITAYDADKFWGNLVFSIIAIIYAIALMKIGKATALDESPYIPRTMDDGSIEINNYDIVDVNDDEISILEAPTNIVKDDCIQETETKIVDSEEKTIDDEHALPIIDRIEGQFENQTETIVDKAVDIPSEKASANLEENLRRLKILHDEGILSDAEYKEKKKILLDL